MDGINSLFLLTGLLLFLSVISTTLSARLGLPLLLMFLGVGMLAGEEGIGGIQFDSFVTATLIGQLALAVILLDGGLRTSMESFRIALKPAAVLASWGVIATVALLGAFATFYMGLDWRFGILMAAIVGSTDAGAVFSLLRNSGVRLNQRVQATLEIESGANDPMAIFLVTALIALTMQPEKAGVGAFLLMLVQQMGFGMAMGYVGGRVLARMVRRLHLAEGLYALLIVSGGLLVFAFTNLIGGSGFLAVYLAGILVGNRRSHATEHVLRVMGLAGTGEHVCGAGLVGNAYAPARARLGCAGDCGFSDAGGPPAGGVEQHLEIRLQPPRAGLYQLGGLARRGADHAGDDAFDDGCAQCTAAV